MPCKNLRFLVVEDHEFQRETLAQLLHTLGAAAVHCAEDGRSALQVLQDPDRPLDIIISDLSMPGMDGLEFVRHLSEGDEHASLIISSGLEPSLLAAVANMARAYNVNVLGVIAKPPTASKVVPLVELYRSAPIAPSPEVEFPLDEIAQAWAKNEFEPWFEPKVDLLTTVVHGVDVTGRWRHPTKGVLEPEVFMPSIHARGLGDDFVWLMLKKSAAQCRQWQLEGFDLTVSVKMEFEALTDINMAKRVRRLALNEGIDPSSMVLSVTEDLLKTDQAKALENLARLRVDGFGLALDDFGSGPMALEQLSLVAFTELKINNSFVLGGHWDERVRAGLAVGLDVADQWHLKTVADGIRSKEDWSFLYEWGCDLGKGSFISPPMPAEGVPQWLTSWANFKIK